MAVTQAYRTDIDGLRAFAVLAVFAAHLQFPFATGGFVGVDIFFVISGYLITGIILPQLAEGGFSLARFYERRVRRIAPALITMLLVVLGIGVSGLLPSELIDLSWSAVTSILSASNIYFWTGTGYFEPAAATRPLLHTWSLAVEEQFYLAFPLLLVLLHRFCPRHLLAAMCILSLVSLIACGIVTEFDSASTFYLAPFRSWELLVGGLLQLLPRRRLTVGFSNLVSAISLCGLAYAVLRTSADGFPGWSALLPVAAASGLIHAGGNPGNLVSRLFSLPPVRWVGLISYSLYLWHWPIIVFNAILDPLDLGVRLSAKAIPIVVAAFALATLSWWLIERPFRNSRQMSWPRVAALTGTGALAALGACGLLIWSGGLSARWPGQSLHFATFLDQTVQGTHDPCFLIQPVQALDPRVCLFPANGGPSVLLIGDSQAAHLAPGLRDAFGPGQVSVLSAVACRNLGRDGVPHWSACAHMAAVLDRWLAENHPGVIILSGRWRGGDMQFLGQVLPMLKSHGGKVVLLGLQLEYNTPPPRQLALQAREGVSDFMVWRREDLDGLEPTLAQVARKAGVAYLSPRRLLCTPGCTALANGAPIYFDTNGHLTKAGSALLAGRIRSELSSQGIVSAAQPAPALAQ